MLKKIVLFIVTAMLLNSCASWFPNYVDWQKKYDDCETNAELWMGNTQHDLIVAMGNSTYDNQSDGAGGIIVTYLTYGRIHENGDKTMLYRQYYINKEGKIYHTRCFIGS